MLYDLLKSSFAKSNTILLLYCLPLLPVIIHLFLNMKISGLSPLDPSSWSRPEEAVVTKLHIVWDVDFKKSILTGLVKLNVEKKTPNAKHLILDAKDLSILSITNEADGKNLHFIQGEPVASFGNKLEIELPQETACGIVIRYSTSPDASALQWLKPEQTAGRRHPYMFSQCQPIHARSMLPCQDTPAIKMPYSAVVTVSKHLVVLMSALRENSTNKRVFKFKQDVPVPSYLIAIAVGDLESRKLGPRSHVWSEREYIDKAAYEFSETEQMLSTAESLCGKYEWGIYDLLVMPPSFPYGGMENPCLTFVTPTLLAGDRSLANVVTHEIAHSWTGNLVTNRNFEHFWLNEGFTVFIERKVQGRLGDGETTRHFQALEGLLSLKYSIETLGSDNALTNLVVDLQGVHPEDAFSTVPYEKGHTFLFYLEELLGGPAVFEPFLRAYLEEFKYQSIETDDFKNFLAKYFSSSKALLEKVDWASWLHTPGMPPIIPKYDTSLSGLCTKLASRWADWNTNDPNPFKPGDIQNFTSPQKILFLAELLEQNEFSESKAKALTELYKLAENKNSEIRFRWIRLCIKARWLESVTEALKFVTEQGRFKFLRPIFRDLYAWEEVRARTVETFNEHKANMMHLTVNTVEKELHLI